MTDEIKYLSAQEFVDLGFLQEVNRLVLHPAGLALAVYLSDYSGPTFDVRVWDYREDPEGLLFAPGEIDLHKAQQVLEAHKSKAFVRNGYSDVRGGIQMPEAWL